VLYLALTNTVGKMNRLFANTTRTALDVLVLSLALAMAYAVRFDGVIPPDMLKRLFLGMPYVVFLQYSLLHAYGVPRFAWRFVGLRESLRILLALVLSMFVLIGLRFVAIELQTHQVMARHLLVPLGVIAADLAISFLGITGMRMLYRLGAEQVANKRRRPQTIGPAVRTLLIGAGDAGSLVAKEITARPDLNIVPVGFVDDDPMKKGQVIHGLTIMGSTRDLARIVSVTGAESALITIASATGPAMRAIVSRCEEIGLPPKIIPNVYEIVGGHVNLSSIRDVTIEDLLGREPVELDSDAIREDVRGRVVMITGAGGSIGSELVRQLARFAPSNLLLVEQAETSLFHIHRELRRTLPNIQVTPCIADVCDGERMERLFAEYKPSIVFHAAAHKHVPMMEWNPGEAVKNNVFGTSQIALLSDKHAVQKFVMISTDKAVNPTSLMGASKRVAEIFIQALNEESTTNFVTVRFGNVLGSAGSVIPIFKEQIARGGPVTVTHPEMERYFMTIPEACQLVLQAGTLGDGGEIFILDMGVPVKIVDLARDLIHLSGLRVDGDIKIEFTGMRPGEKLFEELSVASERTDKTRHPKIYVGRFRPHSFEQVSAQVDALVAIADSADGVALRKSLVAIVPEYRAELLA
jgi:FlaA1/EpsC-like NDP-sugar epimerase